MLLRAVAPVVGAAVVVRNREHLDDILLDAVGHVVGKGLERRPANKEVAREVGDERGGIRPSLHAGKHVVHRVEQAKAKTDPLLLVPAGGVS